MNSLFIFFSGFTFAIGGINFIIGVIARNVRSYLYFGILSLAASIFLLAQIPPIYTPDSPDLSNTISIITAASFYTFILLFIELFTKYRATTFRIIIISILGFLMLTYFILDLVGSYGILWNILAHASILSIGVFGVIGGIKGKNEINRQWRWIFIMLMVVLGLLAFLVGIGSLTETEILPDPEGFISPLDFFPILFSIVIGYKMGSDIIRSYRLENEIKMMDSRWSDLMNYINLIIVQIDLQGTIVWVNNFFEEATGLLRREIIGKDWFETMFDSSLKELERQKFNQGIRNSHPHTSQNRISKIIGSSLIVQWSDMVLHDNKGNISGILSIGADITEMESALHEIENLKNQLEKENLLLKEEVEFKYISDKIIGKSDSLNYVLKRAQQVAVTSSTVLLEGETGVGKELFADLIHHNSNRRHKAIIKVNCASLPKDLIESELFGHEKGSFTGAHKTRQGRFELADQGTIFLDEIGELPLELQPKLLRVLQTGEFERVGSEKTRKVDVRVITATNRNLLVEVERGNFRQDLFFRLNVYPITIPPLRQRKEDIPLLISHFIKKIGIKIGKRVKHISKADLSQLQEYDWPGNIRELENLLERNMISSDNEILKIEPFSGNGPEDTLYGKADTDQIVSLEATEMRHILHVLELTGWKINGSLGAAEKLGMHPSTLRSKMKKLGIERP